MFSSARAGHLHGAFFMAKIEIVTNDVLQVYEADFYPEQRISNTLIILAHIDNKKNSGHVRIWLDRDDVYELAEIMSGADLDD